MDFKIDLLENGLDFIDIAIDNIIVGDNRNLKYGLIHLSAGTDLILKYRLSLEHWSLLFSNIDDAKLTKFENGDFISVNSVKCIERLDKICRITLDEKANKKLKILREKRNKLEHFGMSDSKEAMVAMAVSVLNIVFEFIDTHIKKEDLTINESMLYDEIRAKLISFEKFIETRMKELKSQFNDINDKNLIVECPVCLQEGMYILDEKPTCLFCKYEGDSDEVAIMYVENVMEISLYDDYASWGFGPVYECFDCGKEAMTYTTNSEKGENFLCFGCGVWFDYKYVHHCETCGNIYYDENDRYVIMCNDCIDNMHQE